MSSILLTGVGGYIGSVLARQLLEAGHRVVGVDRFFFGMDLLGARLLQDERFVLRKQDIRLLTPSDFVGIDAVFDLAGLSNDPSCDLDPSLTHDINFQGAVNVARCARQAGVARLVYSSSCSVYGGGDGNRLSEESNPHPISAYAKAKVAAESALLALDADGFTVTVLRNATVYGLSPRMRFDLVINMMALFAWRDRRIYILGGGRQWRPIVHVSDVASAFLSVLAAGREKVGGRIFNVGSNDQNFQVFQIANLIKGVLPETELVTVPDDPDKRSYNVSFDRIADVLSFQPGKTPVDGVLEIKEALECGTCDASDPRTVTLKYYQYLLGAERVVRDVAIGGSIFGLDADRSDS